MKSRTICILGVLVATMISVAVAAPASKYPLSFFSQEKQPPLSSYFSLRMQQLGEQLNITSDQQAKVKSMVKQETAELMQYACNFTTSQKNQVAQFRGV